MRDTPDVSRRLLRLFERLGAAYGPQGWWPASSPFEVAVGAVLVQNTNWLNAERALESLHAHGAVDAHAIVHMGTLRLEPLIRSSGTFRVKAKRLSAVSTWWMDNYEDARGWSLQTLRASLDGVHGVGPETADCIALYAFDLPAFVADGYARRILSRVGVVPEQGRYRDLVEFVESLLPADTQFLNEAHALIVAHAKGVCRPKPRCDDCVLLSDCAHGRVAGRSKAGAGTAAS